MNKNKLFNKMYNKIIFNNNNLMNAQKKNFRNFK